MDCKVPLKKLYLYVQVINFSSQSNSTWLLQLTPMKQHKNGNNPDRFTDIELSMVGVIHNTERVGQLVKSHETVQNVIITI